MVRYDEQFYNVKILQVYVEYLRDQLQWNETQIEELFNACYSDKSILFSDDNWFDQNFADSFHRYVVEATGDQDIAYKVGAYSVHERAKGIAGRLVAGLLTPSAVFQNIEHISSQYSRGTKLITEHLSVTSATVRVELDPNCDERPYQCSNRIGMLEAIPEFFGLPTAAIAHPYCVHRGDESCIYQVEWINHSTRAISIAAAVSAFAGCLFLGTACDNWASATLFAMGAGGVAFTYRRILWSKQLQQALRDQVDALRLSVKTIERRHQESLLIRDINNLTTRMMPTQTLCEVLVDAINSKMRYERVTIFIVEEGTRTIRLRSHAGFDSRLQGLLEDTEFNVNPYSNAGFLAPLINTREPIFIRNIENKLDELSERSRYFIRSLGVKSLIAVPITFEDDVFGIIAVDYMNAENLLTNNDLELLNTVAQHIGVAFSNARSFEQLQRTNELLEMKVAERTAELVAARDEAVKANKIKSAFLANMSHELRTPLNAIIGYSELMEQQTMKEGQNDYVEDLRRISLSGRHLLSMINNVLDMAKIEAGRVDLYIEKFDVENMVNDVTSMLLPLARNNNNELYVFCDRNVGSIWADETKIRQSVLNVVNNACKFTKNGKVYVCISTEKRKLGDYISIEVSDTGIGMTDEQMARLFQEFSQADPATSRQYGGSGLGLAISKRFCNMMGGDITVASKFGEGSVFTILIPRQVSYGGEIEDLVMKRAG